MLSCDVRRKIANSKYAASCGFQIAVDTSVWLCYLTRSNSEMVVNNFGENSMSSVGKWKHKIIFLWFFFAIYLFKCLNNVILEAVMT